MNETNIHDNVFDAITFAIKKMNIFEKTERIKNISFGFAICGSIISIFTLYNTYATLQLKDKIDELEKRINFYNNQNSNISKDVIDTNIKVTKMLGLLDEITYENKKTYSPETQIDIKYNKEEHINEGEDEEECLLEEYYDVRRYTL